MASVKVKAVSSIQSSALSVYLQGSSTAVGEDTVSSVEVSLQAKATDSVTKVSGTIISTASTSSSDGGYAAAENLVEASGADMVKIKTNTFLSADGSFEQSVTRYKVMDTGQSDGGTRYREVIKFTTLDVAPGLEAGNHAIVVVDAIVEADDSLLDAQIETVAVENLLSTSTALVLGVLGADDLGYSNVGFPSPDSWL